VPPDAVIDRQVSRQPGLSLLGGLERHRISTFNAEGLDEPLGHSVRAWRVRPGADVLEAEDSGRPCECVGKVGRAVVAYDLTAIDSLAIEPGQCSAQEANGCGLLLVSENLHIGRPCGVIDGHVDPVVAKAGGQPCSRSPVMRWPN